MWRINDGAVLFSSGAVNHGAGDIEYSPNDVLFAKAGESRSIGFSDGTNALGVFLIDDVHSGFIRSLAFSPDSQLVLSGSDDGTAQINRVADNGDLVTSFAHPTSVSSVDFAPDGKRIATGSADARIWNTNGSLERLLPSGDTRAVRFSPDGKLLLTVADAVLKFWRVSDGALLVTYDEEMNGGARCIDISRDGKMFTYGTANGTVVLARMPLQISDISRIGNQTVLKWQGGSGLYQVQVRRDFTFDSWDNLGGPTTNTIASNNFSGMHFYRVQGLPNP